MTAAADAMIWPVPDAAALLDEALWDAFRHPRGRGGQWREVFKDAPEIAKHLEREAEVKARPPISRREKPLVQTEAYQRGRRRLRYMRESGPHGDEFMYDLATDVGAAGRPQKVAEDQLGRSIAAGDIELWRGFSDRDYATVFTDGSAYYGQGFRGNGIYVASDGGAHDHAVAYAQAPPNRGVVAKADHPAVLHLALRRDAKIVDYDKIAAEAKAEHLRLSAEKADPGTSMGGSKEQVLGEVARDPMRWALATGWDAVRISDKEFAVLNRGALLVSEQVEDAGTNVVRRSKAAA